MGALDQPAQISGPSAMMRAQRYKDEETERAKRELDYSSAQSEADRARMLRLGAGDVMAHLLPENFEESSDAAYQQGNPYRKEFSQTPREYQSGIAKKYGIEALPALAQEHNRALSQMGSAPPEIPGMVPTGVSVDESGRKQFAYGREQAAISPGQKAVDQAYADDFAKWELGGAAAAKANMEKLSRALGVLEKDKSVSGPMTGLLAGNKVGDALLNAFRPEGVATRQLVEQVVQGTLREVLGAQYTEKEGRDVLARAFNPGLAPQENARRVKNLMQQLASGAEAKQSAAQYFSQNGTLQGWKGTMPTFGSLSPETDAVAPAAPQKPVASQGTTTQEKKRYQIVEKNGRTFLIDHENKSVTDITK